MTERFPDLEIYLMKGDPAKVTEWLGAELGDLETIKDTGTHQHWRCGKMDIYMTALETEIRCSNSGWDESEGESDSDGWIKLNARGEKSFSW